MFWEDLEGAGGGTDGATEKLKPNMAIKHRATGIHRFKKKKKKDVDGLAYKVKSETEDAGFMSCTETFWA